MRHDDGVRRLRGPAGPVCNAGRGRRNGLLYALIGGWFDLTRDRCDRRLPPRLAHLTSRQLGLTPSCGVTVLSGIVCDVCGAGDRPVGDVRLWWSCSVFCCCARVRVSSRAPRRIGPCSERAPALGLFNGLRGASEAPERVDGDTRTARSPRPGRRDVSRLGAHPESVLRLQQQAQPGSHDRMIVRDHNH
jgi:hypothetical protein